MDEKPWRPTPSYPQVIHEGRGSVMGQRLLAIYFGAVALMVAAFIIVRAFS